MTRFEPATIQESEIIGTAAGWLELWKQGCQNTRNAIGDVLGELSEAEAMYRLIILVREMAEGSIFVNDKYQVQRREIGNGMAHLSIKRLDKECIHDWRELQEIKNQLIGPENEAIEIYPAESRLMDSANQYHLWCFLDPTYRIPTGFQHRMVTDKTVAKSRNRPFNKEG